MAGEQRRLVLGSRNRHKADELRTLLADVPIDLRSLADYPHASEVVEDGDTFEHNARKKATAWANELGHWVLADDSGLEVDALDGRPGVHSARFAGPGHDDPANNRELLGALAGVETHRRGVRYVCVLVLARPHQVLFEARAHCAGWIADAPRGTSGFGYDPLFVVREYHRTVAELGMTVKNVISHRARALRQLHAALPALLAMDAPPR